MPGNARTLLIWLGKSERPVAATAAPAARASSGMISGTGLAQAKTIGSLAMLRTMSCVSTPGFETPTKTSAPLMASASVPATLPWFVQVAISCLMGLRPSRPS